MINLLFQGQMEMATAMTGLLTRGNFLRVDSTVPSGAYALDSVEQMESMVALGRGVAVEDKIFTAVQSRFLNGRVVDKFIPCHNVFGTVTS